jgi:hypothetical protein
VADAQGRSVAKPGNIQPQPQASQTLVDLPGYSLIAGQIGQSLISSIQLFISLRFYFIHSSFSSTQILFH